MQELAVRAIVRQSTERVQAPCSTCLVKDAGLCSMLIGKDRSNGTANTLPLAQNFAIAQPREIICRAKQPSEHFYVICEGWAFRFHRLQNGRRHILSFLIVGDVVSNFSIFTGSSEFATQALTDVRFCKFDRDQIRARLLQKPEIFEEWLARSVVMLRRVDRAGVALGRLQAHEKIAWLILQLRDRLDANGMINGDAIEFPLRQSHIADAMGLTTVHVCRVLNSLRKQGVFAIEDGVLRISDLAVLRRIANVM